VSSVNTPPRQGDDRAASEPVSESLGRARIQAAIGRPDQAIAILEAALASQPDDAESWLELGDLLEQRGDKLPALLARFEAVTRAQFNGQWVDQSTTPPELLNPVMRAIAQVRDQRREIYFGSYDDLRKQHGAAALVRVDRALSAHLRECDGKPTDPRQKPRFFYFPDLPSEPYLDPEDHVWAPALRAAFPGIREEAVELLHQDGFFEDFVRIRKGDRIENYLGGAKPKWSAFFFYRHGVRYDDNHARCPVTSRAIESIELCRIADHAPEICFSILTPGTHILPHYGVTNVRSVMHLPLLVPQDCALNLVDAGQHAWREGELVMFDDTYLHEAWNRSTSMRVILLMDCWNPHLEPVERQAISRLIEVIGRLHKAARATAS
jgi:aspartyl/asparaginyl beta-hydroxylase (cupin superfamily)